MTSNSQQSGSSTFTPRARLIRHLGEDLIPSDRVAITELVKNSYDADANRVLVQIEAAGPKQSIHVWDDGHGMSLDELLSRWLEIANPNRATRVKSESGKRRVLGAKGLGRFAAGRLGSLIEIHSRRDEQDEVQLAVDWSRFSDDDAYLTDIPVEWRAGDPETFAPGSLLNPLSKDHGTHIRVSGLRHEWHQHEVSDLRIALSRLLHPTPHADLSPHFVPDFEVSVDAEGLTHLSGPLGASETLNTPKYQIIAIISEQGDAVLTSFSDQSPTGEHSSITIPTEGTSCGPLELDIRAWDLDTASLRALVNVDLGAANSHDVRRTIRENSGIAIYRDGFRVQPYGDADNDWLNLDLRRVNNPTLRLSNNQVSGFIFTTADDNSDLRDQSNRLGLIENESYADLKNKVLRVLAELEKMRYSRRRGDEGADSENERRRGIFDAFRLDGIKTALNAPGAGSLKEAVDQAEESIADGIAEIEESLSRYSRLATLGSLVDIVLHDGRTALLRMSYSEKRLSAAAEREDYSSVKAHLQAIQEQANVIDRLFSRIEPLSGRKRGRPRVVAIGEIARKALEVFHKEISPDGIRASVLGETIAGNLDEVDVLQILVNLVGNSVYWLKASNTEDPIIEIEIEKSDDALTVSVSDNGPGVPAAEADRVFEAYFTSKPDGMGMGLAISGAILQDFYNGSLEQRTPGKYGGATFVATFRRRLGNN